MGKAHKLAEIKRVEAFLQSDLRYRKSFNALIKCWALPCSLTLLICRIVLFDDQSKLWPKKKQRVASGTHKTIDSLKNFPKRLQGIAEEAEHVNRAVALHYDIRSDNNSPVNRLDEALKTLREYACFLEEHLNSENDNVEINKEIALSEANEAFSSLCETVKQVEGRPMYREVAALLTGAAQKLGIANDEQEYSPDAVKMRLFRIKDAK